MNETTNDVECGWVREAMPDFAAGRAPAADAARIQRHVAACADCRAELDLVRLLFVTRAEPPAGLVERIVREAVVVARRPSRTWWGISAAAIAAFALGIGIVSSGAPATNEVPAFVREAEEGEFWLSGDGLVAGAPALDYLSDEALLQFLDELTSVSTGGTV